MNSSFELKHRYVFGIDIFDDAPLEYLDNDTVVFLSGGVVILYNTKTKGQQVIGEDPSSKFKVESFHTARNWILLLQSNRVNGAWRIVSVDKGNIEKRSSFNLYHCEEQSDQSSSHLKEAYQARICVTEVNDELLIAVLERNDGSTTISLRSIDGTVLGQSTVAELNGLSDASVSFQSGADGDDEDEHEPNAVVTVQTSCSLLFYRVKYRCEGWNLSLANFPPSKMSLGISGSIISHCSVQKRKETTVFFSSCRKLVCTESGVVTCSQEIDFDIQCMVGLDNGFSAGCSDGILRIYEISRNEIDGHSELSCSRMLSDPESSSTSPLKLMSLALAPRGNVICALVSEPNKLIEIDLHQDSNEVTFSTVLNVHNGSINSADTCIQSPLLATAGSDGTIRLWNYNSGKSLMVTRPFLDAPLRVSMHPSGLHILISFADEVLLARILVDELRIIRRMALKHCRICTFSSGGNHFSLSHDNVIHIFDFISGDKIQVLKGHNSRVSSVLWIEGDTSIISCDEDGMIYRFDVSSGIRCQECTLYKSCNSIKYAIVDDLWVYSPENFDILSPGSLSKTDKVKQKVEVKGVVKHVVSSHEPSLFCIVVSKEFESYDDEKEVWVISIYSTPEKYTRFNINEEVTSISLSCDDQVLTACLRTGAIIVYNLTETRESSLLMTEGPSICNQSLDEYWNDLTLVSGFVLQEKSSIFSGLGTLEQELNANHEYKRSTCKISTDEKASELENRYRQLVNDGAARIMAIQNKASEITSRHNAMVTRQQGIFQYASDQIQSQYQKSTQDLLQELNRTKLQWDSRLRELETLRNDTIFNNTSSKNIFEEEAKVKLEDCRNIVENFENELVELKLEHEEMIHQMEDDIDDEIESIKAQNKKKIASAREKTMKASSDNGIALKRMSALQRNIEDCKDVIKMQLTRDQDLQGFVSKLERSIELLKEERRQKSEMLRIRRTAADRLNNKKKHLNNFTSILTEKLDETKLHLPCDKGVDDVKMEIEKMFQELNHIRKDKSDIETWLSDQAKVSVANIQEDIAKARKKYSKLTTKWKNNLKLLQDCIDVIQRPDELRNLIEKENTLRVWPMKDKTEKRHDRSKEVLELQKELNVAKRSLASIKTKQGDELAHAKNRNHLLLNEIAKKRKELLAIRTQIGGLQSNRL